MPYTKCTMVLGYTSNKTNSTQARNRTSDVTESHYYASTDASVYIPAFRNLCQARANMLASSSLVVGQRYQQVDPVGPGQSDDAQYPGSSTTLGDIPQMTLLCSCPAMNTRNISRLKIRLMADARVVEGEFNPSQGFTNALEFYKFALSPFFFRARDLGQVATPIVSITIAGTPPIATVVTESPHGLAAGDMFRVLRSLDVNGRKRGGRFKVSTIPSPDSLTFAGWTYGNTLGGKTRKDVTIYVQYNTSRLTIGRIITVKVGRPSKGYSGRRSNRR